MKKKISLTFCDMPGSEKSRHLIEILSDKYEIEHDIDRPDYVIYSVFGHDFIKYKDAVRIFITGENIRPDFNLCDYAFSFDWIDFGDRHTRLPNFVTYDAWKDISERGSSALSGIEGKQAFCNFIYSNRFAHPARDAFFHALNAVEPVEALGPHLRNSARPIGEIYVGDWSRSKVEAQRQFKFSIAFENSPSPGYTTEKIVHALSADTIPIYWGDPLVSRMFNEDRFIDVRRLGVDGAIERVLALHRDDAAYLDMVNRPFLASTDVADTLSEAALLAALAAIFDRPLAEARRRNMFAWGRKYEAERHREIRAAAFARKILALRFWK